MNVEITGGPDGTVHLHVAEGALAPGHRRDAGIAVRMPYDLAHRALRNKSSTALLSAYLSGELRIEGELSALLALQRHPKVAASEDLLERIASVTL